MKKYAPIAFALCYVMSHVVFGCIDEDQARLREAREQLAPVLSLPRAVPDAERKRALELDAVIERALKRGSPLPEVRQ